MLGASQILEAQSTEHLNHLSSRVLIPTLKSYQYQSASSADAGPLPPV